MGKKEHHCGVAEKGGSIVWHDVVKSFKDDVFQVGLAGEAVVGSYSYRDEVKQKHYTAEGEKSKMFPNIYECGFFTNIY